MTEATLDTAVPVSRDENAVDLGCTVSVESFSGPLDLLLFLVRKSELDIIDIPIATIADQFVMLVASWQQEDQLDLEMAGDFILMAATLLEIKARTIAPPPVTDGEQADTEEDDLLDPRADLIGKLLAYRRFKEAVGLLVQAESARSQLVLRQTREDIPEDPDEAGGIDLGELQVSELSKYWYTLLARIGGAGPRTVMKDDLPIEGSIRKLSERAEAEQQLTLQQLFAGEPTLQGRVSMLMATLECARQRIVRTAQLEQYGEIAMQFRPAADRIIVPVEFPPEEGGKKRSRRPPLVTFTAPVAPSADEQEDVPDVEEKHETDEERFLRELNEACDLDGVLARVHDIEQGFQQYWEVLHPTPSPVVAAVPESAAVVSAPVQDEVVPAEAPAAVQAVVEILPTLAGQPEGTVAEIPVVAEIQVSADTQASVEARGTADLGISADVLVSADVPVSAKTTWVTEPSLSVMSHDDVASAPVIQESVIAVCEQPEVQAPEVGLPAARSCAVESTTAQVLPEQIVQKEHAPALFEPQAELAPEPIHDVMSTASGAVAEATTSEPVVAVTDTVSLVSSVAPLVTVAVDETQVIDPIPETGDLLIDPAPMPVTPSGLGNAVESFPLFEVVAAPGETPEPEVDAALATEQEMRTETAPDELSAPELESVSVSTVVATDLEPFLESSNVDDFHEPVESDAGPVPAATSDMSPAATEDMVAVSKVELHAVEAPPALIVDAPQVVAPQPAMAPTLAVEPALEVVAVTIEEASAVPAAATSTETVAELALHVAPAPAEAHVREPVTEASAPEIIVPAPVSVASAPVAPRGLPSASSAGLRSRTLWLMLAGTASAACAVWWYLRTASLEPEPAVVAAVPVPVASPAPDADVGAPATAPISQVDPATLAVSPTQPTLAPISQAGLWIVQTAPSHALIERFIGGAEQWLTRQFLPIAVPWYACTEVPMMPAGPAAFTSEPRFDGLPVLAWARPESWVWCLQARAVPPSEPFLPLTAFIPALALPESVALWAQLSSLAGVPVATFAQDLGWTVLVRPAPVPQLEIWLGSR